jgi:hypothetical protein
MPPAEETNADSRAIQALAQSLYEAEDPGRIPWVKRAAIVRQPWLLRARTQLRAEQGPGADQIEGSDA